MFNFLKHIKIFSITFLVLLALLSFSNYASAESASTMNNDDALESTFCNIFRLSKSIGRPLLLLIIVFIAALAYFGKVQLVAIVMIVIGAAVFFGAPTIVGLITGDRNTSMCSGDYQRIL